MDWYTCTSVRGGCNVGGRWEAQANDKEETRNVRTSLVQETRRFEDVQVVSRSVFDIVNYYSCSTEGDPETITD